MKKKPYWQLIYALLFMLVICATGICAMRTVSQNLVSQVRSFQLKNAKQWVLKIEKTIDTSLQARTSMVDLYGLTQRLLFRPQVRSVTKSTDGMLHRLDSIPSDDILIEYAHNLSALYTAAQKRAIPFLYIQAPSDILEDRTRLPYGLEDLSNKRIDLFLKMLHDRSIPVLDTREHFLSWPARDVFYATDHHWTTKAAFSVMGEIISELNVRYSLDLDHAKEIRDMDNYNTVRYPSSFLGSRGIRTGKYYAGIDDFEYYEPTFYTDLQLQFFKKNTTAFERRGAFRSALINTNNLISNYKNKYNSFLFAQTDEGKITNHAAPEGKRCLVVGDSFMRSLVPYLSLCFGQTAFLDPQPGRYRKNYIDYIDSYQPEVMIVLFNGLGVYTDIPAFDGRSFVQENGQ